jgi:hypothetical protein
MSVVDSDSDQWRCRLEMVTREIHVEIFPRERSVKRRFQADSIAFWLVMLRWVGWKPWLV